MDEMTRRELVRHQMRQTMRALQGTTTSEEEPSTNTTTNPPSTSPHAAEHAEVEDSEDDDEEEDFGDTLRFECPSDQSDDDEEEEDEDSEEGDSSSESHEEQEVQEQNALNQTQHGDENGEPQSDELSRGEFLVLSPESRSPNELLAWVFLSSEKTPFLLPPVSSRSRSFCCSFLLLLLS